MNKTSNEVEELNQSGFDPELVSLLKDLINTGDFIPHIQAQEKLSAKGRNVLPVMHKLLQSRYPLIRKEAIKIVELISHKASIPHVIKILEDRESDIRWMAAVTLIRIGRASIRPLLKEMVSNGTSYNIRHEAHHVLSELIEEDDPKALKKLLRDLKSGKVDPERIPVEASKIIDKGIV